LLALRGPALRPTPGPGGARAQAARSWPARTTSWFGATTSDPARSAAGWPARGCGYHAHPRRRAARRRAPYADRMPRSAGRGRHAPRGLETSQSAITASSDHGTSTQLGDLDSDGVFTNWHADHPVGTLDQRTTPKGPRLPGCRYHAEPRYRTRLYRPALVRSSCLGQE